jgi:tRNA(Arg) A34 adenosine deaminase TadA
MSSDDRFVDEVVALARRARAAGNHPFGALLVLDGRVVLTAQNTVHTGADPTAHAETNLVDAAIRTLSADERRRSVLYASCEPCAMCVGKIYWAGIRSVVFVLSATELAELAGGEFLVPCRELFARARDAVAIAGPLPAVGARDVHVGYWRSAGT